MKKNKKKSRNFFILTILFFFVGLGIAALLQMNSQRNFTFDPQCTKSIPVCSSSHKAGFPFVFYQSKQHVSYPTDFACLTQLDSCKAGTPPWQKIQVAPFLFDVIILAVLLTSIAVGVAALLIFGMGVPFRGSWLAISLVVSTLITYLLLQIPFFFDLSFIEFMTGIALLPLSMSLGLSASGSNFWVDILFHAVPFSVIAIVIYVIIWAIKGTRK